MNSPILMTNLKAAIFDFDGVLLDTSDQLCEGYTRVIAEYGIEYKIEQFNENYGLKTKEHFAKVLRENNIELQDPELDVLVKKRDTFYREKCQDVTEPLPGVVDLLEELKKNGLKIGVASSTSKDNLDHFLPKIGILKYFDYILAGTQVSHGKPHPEIYLKTCEMLGIEPQYCVGFEDTDKGVAALKNAGIKAVAITLTNRKSYDFSNADLVVKTLGEINFQDLISLIG
jgi:beta-phosphoglucomutase